MHLQAHLFDDYWEDIGTIASFFEANLALATNPPRFEFYDANNPIYTSARFLPPARIEKCHLVDAIVSHGSWVAVRRSSWVPPGGCFEQETPGRLVYFKMERREKIPLQDQGSVDFMK